MTVFIASHAYRELVVPDGYAPLFVGTSLHLDGPRRDGWLHDDYGRSISERNTSFCELTGTYWIWKNICENPRRTALRTASTDARADDGPVGLVHYRRYLADDSGNPLTAAQMTELLARHDCLMARRHALTFDRYSISCAEHYRHLHSANDLRILRDVVSREAKEYLPAFDECMDAHAMHPCNILLGTPEVYRAYCAFLFKVLAACDHAIDPVSFRDAYQQRVFGFLGERLADVFVSRHGLDVRECPVVDPLGNEQTLRENDAARRRADLATPLPAYDARFGELDYNPVFDAKFYLAHHNDVLAWAGPDPARAFEHFLEHGAREGRVAHPMFSLRSYRNAHPELAATCHDDPHAWIARYLETRRKELYAFGFENFRFDDERPKETGATRRTCIDGRRFHQLTRDRALKRAAAQGAID